jgi:hypothetical protein
MSLRSASMSQWLKPSISRLTICLSELHVKPHLVISDVATGHGQTPSMRRYTLIRSILITNPISPRLIWPIHGCRAALSHVKTDCAAFTIA